MNKNILFILTFSLTLTLCNFLESTSEKSPIFMIWESESSLAEYKSNEQIEGYLKKLKSNNISAIYLNAAPDYYKRVGVIANTANIQLFTWVPTMTVSDSVFMEKNKDWYAVNRNNISCIDEPPYVNYYRWLCPNEPKVYDYLVNKYLDLAKIGGVTGIHLDYIRYCDIYLPKGLRKNYNLVQDYEMPEFDYCYCYRCRDGFEKIFGYDPLHLDDPASDFNWKTWRLDSIVSIVNKISEEVKSQTNKLVTAAVFPTPRMSEEMVRQAWGKFKIDAVLPMLYNGFYEEEISWIGKCVKEGISTMEVKKTLFAGVFLADITEENKFKEAIQTALDNGANGVSFFTGNDLTEEHLKILRSYN